MEIKICGITTAKDASFAVECGADAIGFIFYPQSPRYVTPDTVKKIREELPDNIIKIGVFVNHDALEVKKIAAFCGLDMVQFHGAESPAYCRQFPLSMVIKAFAPRTMDDLAPLRGFPAKAILVDAYDPVCHGGTGERAHWDLAVKVKEQHPLILAGGLSLINIQEAIEHVAPHAVDINSGVESAPGHKDHTKVKEIIELIRRLGKNGATIF